MTFSLCLLPLLACASLIGHVTAKTAPEIESVGDDLLVSNMHTLACGWRSVQQRAAAHGLGNGLLSNPEHELSVSLSPFDFRCFTNVPNFQGSLEKIETQKRRVSFFPTVLHPSPLVEPNTLAIKTLLPTLHTLCGGTAWLCSSVSSTLP